MTRDRVKLVIKRLERLTNSRAGNPRWEVTFTNGWHAKTSSNSMVGYVIDNPDYIETAAWFDFNASGDITGVTK